MRASRRLLGAAAAVAVLTTAACGSDSSESTDTAESATTEASGDETTDTEAPTTEAATDDETADTEAPAETDAVEAPVDTEPPFVAPDRGDADLVIWADDTRAPVLAPIAEAFSAEEGVEVSVLEVPFDEIRDNLSVQGPAGEGPDIVVGAHDWLGELVSNGVVLPIDLGPDADLYSDVAIDVFTSTASSTVCRTRSRTLH